ncbi:MAG: hypothetical protein IT305_33145 [Chloroflexi bacterium]|nr:hypothetical protein [Chloroflexota bacterium]
MTAVYEVWDTGTFNRIGVFPDEAGARALLDDVLRVNGPEVAARVDIIAYGLSAEDESPTLVVEGAEFVKGVLANT